MKKLILLCLVFVFSNTFFAQTVTEKKTKTKTEKKATTVKKKTKTEATKLKKDGTPDKRYKKTEKVVLKKDGTPDKRYVKENSASTTGVTKSTAGKAKAAANKAEAKIKKNSPEEKENMRVTATSKAAEKRVKDKASGNYNGKKVFTGPRGGRYYINKNGNKTYIDRD